MTTAQRVDPLRACKEAKDELERRRRELAETGEFLSSLGHELQQQPIRLMLANTQGTDFSAPVEISMSPRVPTLDFKKWPAKEDVAATLKAYYDAEHAYRNAYSSLPPGDRDMFQSPR